MGWVVPCGAELLTAPGAFRKEPGLTPSEACSWGPKGRPALFRLDAGRRGGPVPGEDRQFVTSCSPCGGGTVTRSTAICRPVRWASAFVADTLLARLFPSTLFFHTPSSLYVVTLGLRAMPFPLRVSVTGCCPHVIECT